jgi:hypothetical protein
MSTFNYCSPARSITHSFHEVHPHFSHASLAFTLCYVWSKSHAYKLKFLGSENESRFCHICDQLSLFRVFCIWSSQRKSILACQWCTEHRYRCDHISPNAGAPVDADRCSRCRCSHSSRDTDISVAGVSVNVCMSSWWTAYWKCAFVVMTLKIP